MSEIYLNLIGMAAAILIFTAGIYMGRKFDNILNNTPNPRDCNPAPPLSDAERRKIREEQEAFQILQNYSVSDAYGLNADFHLTYHPENNHPDADFPSAPDFYSNPVNPAPDFNFNSNHTNPAPDFQNQKNQNPDFNPAQNPDFNPQEKDVNQIA